MEILGKITGSDITKQLRGFDLRAKKLPTDYQESWEEIKLNLCPRSDFTSRNLIPLLDGVLGLLEEAVADGQNAQEVFGADIKGFCSALVGEEGATCYREKWRKQLDDSVNKELGK